MSLAPETLCVKFVDIFRARWAGREPSASVVTFRPPIGALFPGALVNFDVIESPASEVADTASGESFLSSFFCSDEAGASIRV